MSAAAASARALMIEPIGCEHPMYRFGYRWEVSASDGMVRAPTRTREGAEGVVAEWRAAGEMEAAMAVHLRPACARVDPRD